MESVNVTNVFTARMLWMDNKTLTEGKSFFIKIGTKNVSVIVRKINYQIDVNTGKKVHKFIIYKNQLVECEFLCDEKITVNKFSENKVLGAFIVIDRVSNMTSGCGVIVDTIVKNDYIYKPKLEIDRKMRSHRLEQRPMTIWLTGLSGTGKSTLANELEKQLTFEGKHTMILDGDILRMGVNQNIGFDMNDRIENSRRVAEIAKILNEAGLIAVVALISPYEKQREMAKHIIGDDSYYEIYVKTSIEECERRDVKGLYKEARKGNIHNFTGLDSEYEVPNYPNLVVDTENYSIKECVDYIIKKILPLIKIEE